MDANKILYDYIIQTYGSVVDFSYNSDIPLIDLNDVLLKDSVFEEICMGFAFYEKLGIDINEFVFNNQIKCLESPENGENYEELEKRKKSRAAAELAAKNDIYGKCNRLSELEKKKVLEYIEHILNGEENKEGR